VGGWSYGGILTNYVITKTERFAGAGGVRHRALRLAPGDHQHELAARRGEVRSSSRQAAAERLLVALRQLAADDDLAVAERLVEGAAERERDVLHRVVRIYLQVTPGT